MNYRRFAIRKWLTKNLLGNAALIPPTSPRFCSSRFPVSPFRLVLNGYIDLLFVSPDNARQGIATKLLRHAEVMLQGHGVASLFTEASLVARPFFERNGFVVEEEEQVSRRGVTFRRFAMRKWLAKDLS